MVISTIKKNNASVEEKKSSANHKLVMRITKGKTNIPSDSKKIAENIPENLADDLSVVVDGKLAMEQLKSVVEPAEKNIKIYGRRRFVEEFVRTGIKPEGAFVFSDENVSLDYIQTKGITLTKEKVEELLALGFSISKYILSAGITIDNELLEKHNLTLKVHKAIADAIASVEGITPEIIKSIVKPRTVLSENLLDDIVKIAKSTLPAGSKNPKVVTRVLQLLEILDPTSQLKNLNNNDKDIQKSVKSLSTLLAAAKERKAKKKKT